MEDFSPEWLALPKKARTRLDQIDRIATFRLTEDRWPSSTGATAEERSLARNVRQLRDEEQHEAVLDRIAERLGELPARAFRGDGTALDEALAQFRAQHGRDPRHNGDTTAERNLAYRVYRHNAALTGNAGDLIADTTPTGRERTFDSDRFQGRVEELLKAKDRLGHWPRRSSDDHEERKLAHFHVKLRQPLPKAHAEILWELDPDLARWATDSRDTKTRNFEADVQGIAQYIETHAKKPRHTDPDPEVRRLARRLAKMRKEGVTHAQRTYLKRHLPLIAPPSAADVKAAGK